MTSATTTHFPRPLRKTLIALGFTTILVAGPVAWGQSVPLGTASSFGVLGGSTVTNTGPSVVSGNVGVSPGTAMTGFPPGSIVTGTGTLRSADAVANQAQSDLTIAYTNAAGRACGTTIAGGILGGRVLTPGVYCMGAGDLTGVLTLNGAGVYIFQFGSTFIAATSASVLLTNGASACDVNYQVTSSATLGTSSLVQGNILALTSITLNTNASLNGRALARNGAVTLDSNSVSACAGPPVPPPPPPPPGIPIPGGPTPTPTLSEWAMLMLAGLLGLAAFPALRRKFPAKR